MTDKERKAAFVARLQSMTIPQWLDDVDPRIGEYIRWVRDHCQGADDQNNVDMVAACCKFLRMANVYGFDVKHVQRYIKMAENLELDSLDGKRRYRLTAAQVFIIAGLHGFTHMVTMERYGQQVTEERKVTQDAILFVARKFGKTQIDAWEALDQFLFGDNDAEVHIVSNSLDQSLIAYRAIKAMLEQIDPQGQTIRLTQKEITWRNGRKAAIYPHTAGGKKKDGAKASLVLGDEAGSADYIKNKSDMFSAMEVYLSSMGTRRNRLGIISTTAGMVIAGPFETKMKAQQAALYHELDLRPDEEGPTDSQFLYSCHPDEWERSDEFYGEERIWKKCNPHCGITIQPTFYKEEWAKAIGDPEHYKEVVTKLFNQFVSPQTRPWITADNIRHLQGTQTIRQLDRRHWACWAGMDFSKGDDLCSISYVAYNVRTKQFLWDTDAWIAEGQLSSHPHAVLYQQWVRDGWLHTCPGNVIDSAMVLRAIDEVNQHVNFMAFGYDPYDSSRFVNDIKAWLVGQLRRTGAMGRKLEERLKQMLQPVSQTFSTYNAVCQQVYDYVNWPEQRVWVSPNPLLPWTFGNAILMESNDGFANVKPVKSAPNAKVDPVQAICTCYIMINRYDGK